MESLAIKKIILIFVVTAFAIGLNAQDYQVLEKAFSESYTLENEGNYSHAIELMKQQYENNQDMYEINLRLGWLTYLSGSFIESSAFYKKAVDLKPMSIEAKFGYIYPASALGNWEQVKNQYQKILEIDPKSTRANYYMGMIYYGKEDFQTAYKYFEQVVNLYPFEYDALIMLAWTNYKLGKLREAKILFNKVLLIQPDDDSANEGLELIK